MSCRAGSAGGGRVAGHPPAGIFLRGWVELRLCFMPCPVRGAVTALFTLVTQTAAPALSGAITSVQRMSPAWNRSRIFFPGKNLLRGRNLLWIFGISFALLVLRIPDDLGNACPGGLVVKAFEDHDNFKFFLLWGHMQVFST